MARAISVPMGRARPPSAIRHVLCIAAVLALTPPLDAPAQAQAPDASAEPAGRLTLQQAIERALAASPRLWSAHAGVDAARGAERQARRLPNPEFSLEVENFEGGGPYQALDGAEITYGLSQRVEIGGARSARRGAAKAERQAAERAWDTARLDLIRDVTVAFVEAASADESLKLAEELEAVAKGILNDVTTRVEAAREPLIQRSKAEVALATSRIAEARAASARTVSRQRLARFWGEPALTEELTPVDALLLPEPLETYEARLGHAPDVARYTHLRDAREAELRLAQAERVPAPKLTAGIRQFRETDESAFIAGISLPIPVFDWNRGEIARARAEVVRADSDLRQAGLTQAQRLIQAWSAWQSAALEAKALKAEILPQAERAFRLSLEGYRAGRFPYLDVLDAQRTLFEARAQQVATLARLHTARAEVERLAGASETDKNQ